MAQNKQHDYHIVSPSIWPFMAAVSVFTMLLGLVFMVRGITPFLFFIGLVGVFYVMFAWWYDVIKEAQSGDHTRVVQIGLRYGMILFILSEAFFFLAWFWSFFKHALYPMDAIDNIWPPEGVITFDPWDLPLINTLVLLCSGAAATWAHHAIAEENNRKDLILGLLIAVLFGALFTLLQAYEYSHAGFSFANDIYGANFFLATGFHGVHVIIGSVFLLVCYFRARAGHFTPDQHVGFEAAAWYWHFVDVVWLFLFASIYIWGG